MPVEAAFVRDRIADPALLTHWLVLGHLTLPGEPQHVRSARTFVAQVIGAHHRRADEALLLTSELVTNAVTHSRSRLPGGTFDVVVAAKVAGLLICVTDDGSDSTRPALASTAGGEHGNGLLLTDSIADSWGCLRCSRRIMVWFKLRTHASAPSNAGPPE
jgi:serine/threonine-protein kinase RsbW